MIDKIKYDELIKRVKATTKYFAGGSQVYYRKLDAIDFPEFFSDSEVARSKEE